MVMVSTEDSKLNIYEATTLLWSCDLSHKAISLSRCFLSSMPGGLVTLSTDGIVNVGFLGTEPDLNPNASPINDTFDPKQVQTELEAVEESLQNIMNAKGGKDIVMFKLNMVRHLMMQSNIFIITDTYFQT